MDLTFFWGLRRPSSSKYACSSSFKWLEHRVNMATSFVEDSLNSAMSFTNFSFSAVLGHARDIFLHLTR